MSQSPLTILLSAVEPSGDALGAGLMAALNERAGRALRFVGCGGPLMAAQGLNSAFPIDAFSVIGPVGALAAAPKAFSGAGALGRLAATEGADAAVLIDGWSFSRLAAARIQKHAPATKIYKYVAPQVWASRPKRAEDVARLFDGVLTLFQFETPYFDGRDLRVASTGHPVFQAAREKQANGEAFREAHEIGGAPLLAVAMGSRRAEIARHAAPFGDAIRRLCGKIPDLRVVAPLAPSVEEVARAAAADWPGRPVFVRGDERFGAFAAADAGLAASGTVTTELAISETPMVVAYKAHPLTAMWIRHVITTPHVCLLNIAAGEEIAPEFLQEACVPETLAAGLEPLFTDGSERRRQLGAFPNLLENLGIGGGPAAVRAADTILEWLREDARDARKSPSSIETFSRPA